jgi:transcriptional regulator with XRE-family HTH domain
VTVEFPETLVFGSALRALRCKQGLSLGDLAQLVNYSKSHLSRVETGKKQPSSDLARHCDAVLGAEGRLIRIVISRPQRRRQIVRQLPRIVDNFVGRTNLLRKLDEFCPEDAGNHHRGSPLVLVDGPVGVGKTETVLRWAHTVAERFPDGTLFADLNGYRESSPPLTAEQVLRRFLRDLGVSDADLQGDAQQLGVPFRNLLTGKRMLIVLDNVTRPGQVRPLLPASSGCMTVVTSRSRMPGLVARDGALRLEVPPMPPKEGLDLLAALSPECPPSWQPEFLEACGYMPLLIRIASRRRMNSELYENLRKRESATLLRIFSAGDDDSTSVRTLLLRSYEVLSADAAGVFRLLATRTEGRFTLHEAAQILGIGQLVAEELLSELATLHLLRFDDERFWFDPVHQAFAMERAVAEGIGSFA